MTEHKVGYVEHYYPKAHAAAVHLDAPLEIGDEIHVRDRDEDFIQTVASLQLDHEPIKRGRAGDSIGVQMERPVHEKAEIFILGREA